MKIFSKFLTLITIGIASNTLCAQAQQIKPGKHPFTVYAFIPYGGYTRGDSRVNASLKDIQKYLGSFGIQKYDLIYENKMLDYPNGDKAKGTINQYKMDSLASRALQEPDILVSLDLEGWKRFDTLKTPARMIEAINAFRKINKVSKIGLYATVPQDTYGNSPNISRYDQVNKAYSAVAASVDYYSPSLYNYNGSDTTEWNKGTLYNIAACRKYNFAGKKIIPYITPEVTIKGSPTTFLTYDEMRSRLQTLYNMGADGVLLWTSSGTRDANGQKIYLDVNEGWLKAVRDFMASN